MEKKEIVNTFLTPDGVEGWCAHLNTKKLTRDEHGALQWPNHRKSLLDWLVGIGKIIHDPSIASFISDYPKKQVMCKIEERCSHQRWITTKRDDLSMVTEIIARDMGERVDFLRGETHECPTRDMTQATAWAELKTLAEQTRYLLLTLQEMLRVAPSWEGQQFLRGVIDSLVRDTQGVTDFIRTYYKG